MDLLATLREVPLPAPGGVGRREVGGGTEASLPQSVPGPGAAERPTHWVLVGSYSSQYGRWANLTRQMSPREVSDFSKVTQPIFLQGKNIPYSH